MTAQTGNWQWLGNLINEHMNSVARVNGGAAAVQQIAKNGLGMTLSDSDAQSIATSIQTGQACWTDLFVICMGKTDAYGQTLDNRAEASYNFIAGLAAANKSDFLKGDTVYAAFGNLLQNIDSTTASLNSGTSGLNNLIAKLGSSGLQSTIIDGYVRGATVFIDANGDGIQNSNEWSTTTDANGNYTLPSDAASGKIVAFGGLDILTGKAFQGVLTAPAGSTVINPITTLVQALLDGGQAATMQSATAMVQKALGLPTDANVLAYDPLAVLADSSANASAKGTALSVQKAALQIANIITQFSSTIDAASASIDLQTAAKSVISALAASVANAASTAGVAAIDLTSVSVLATVVQAAAAGASSAVANQLAQVTSACNTSVGAATGIVDLAKAAVVSQGDATQALINGIASGSLGSAVSNFTGSALTTAELGVSTVGLNVTASTSVAAAAGSSGSSGESSGGSEPPSPPTFTLAESGGVVTLSGNSTEVFAYTIGGAATRAGKAVTASAGDLTNGTRVDASGYTAGTTDIVFSAASNTVTGSPHADTVTPVTGVTSSSDLKGGANVVIVTSGADIAAGTFSATGGSVGYNLDAAATGTLNATQAAAIASAAGVQNISLSNQALGLTLNAAVETFTLGNFANSVILGAAAQNVACSGGNDTVALAALTATGTIALAAGTNHVTATVGGDISGATISAVGGTADLTLSGDGTQTLSTAEYNLFNATGITFTATAGAANATIVFSDAGSVTANANVYHYVLSAAGNAITLINGNDTVTGAAGDDSVALAALTATGAMALGTGTNHVTATVGGDISGATISAVGGTADLTLSGDGTQTLSTAEYNLFNATGITFTATAGAANDTIVFSDAGSVTANANVYHYVLSAAGNAITLINGNDTVTGAAGNDSVALAALTATGTIALGAGTNHVTATVGGDISGATISAVGGTADLTLSGDGTQTLSTAEYNLFNATGITFTATAGAANDTIVFSDAGSVTANANVYHYVLSAAGNAITLINGNDTVTGSAGNDSVDVAGLKVTGAIDLGAGTNHVAASSGAVLNATLTGSGTADLTLAAGAGITMNAANYTRFNTAGIAAAGTETITLSDVLSGAPTLNANVETFVLAAGDNSVTSGADGQTINAGALAAGQTLTLAGTQRAAVALTAGNLASTSSGNLTVTATGNNTITTGSGNDVFDFTAAGVVFSRADTIDGGTGADTLKIGAVSTTDALTNVSGVEDHRLR